MTALALIVGLGGLNAAGRSSGFHSYKRMVSEALDAGTLMHTWRDLAWRMNIPIGPELTLADIKTLKAGTLVRKIDHFNPDQVPSYQPARLEGSGLGDTSFICHKSKLPQPFPSTWKVEAWEGSEVKVTISGSIEILVPNKVQLSTTSGGCLPAGFDPGRLYHSHNHPRGLKLAVYGASDALNSLGIAWETIVQQIKPDEVAVYAASALSQVDADSMGGIFTQFLKGNRISSKMMPLSLAEMPADFVNGYVINNVGTTGANVGACATFLYNLRQATLDIQTGKAKVAFVGAAEAPLVPEIIEGFNVMGALATDAQLAALDKSEATDHRRACRPFSTNVGFTMAEASQFIVLMHDELALKLGLTIYGAVGDVFINADANKKSISKPGIGNYLTLAKATALANSMLSPDELQHTYVSSHGTGTPQNRTTESQLLNDVAKTFSIKAWPVTAIKSYVGHSISAAAGDQLIAALGTWQYGWIPGIQTIDHIAEDVQRSHLNILMDHYYAGTQGASIPAVLINSKGFGGNNATALILSPQKTMAMLKNKYSSNLLSDYWKKNIDVRDKQALTDAQTCQGNEKLTYRFGENLIDENSVTMTPFSISLPGFSQAIELPSENPYKDYLDI
ncbi:MAG: beta-ketoacyl synthase [Legionella sp.]|nr:beta-ketoacyl synthase [Legionella sp.]